LNTTPGWISRFSGLGGTLARPTVRCAETFLLRAVGGLAFAGCGPTGVPFSARMVGKRFRPRVCGRPLRKNGKHASPVGWAPAVWRWGAPSARITVLTRTTGPGSDPTGRPNAFALAAYSRRCWRGCAAEAGVFGEGLTAAWPFAADTAWGNATGCAGASRAFTRDYYGPGAWDTPESPLSAPLLGLSGGSFRGRNFFFGVLLFRALE